MKGKYKGKHTYRTLCNKTLIVFITSLIFLMNTNFINVLFINNSLASNLPQIQQQILQQQEQQRQQEINKRQMNEIKKLKQAKESKEEKETKDKSKGNDGDGNSNRDIDKDNKNKDDNNKNSINTSPDPSCKIYFKAIEVNGNRIFTRGKLNKKVLNKYINKCINRQNIKALQNDIIQLYINKGYVNTRVYFDFNDKQQLEKLKEGIFKVIIDEGIVENIVLINNKNYSIFNNKNNNTVSSPATFFAFPLLKHKPFNLKDYEQGLDQMNRLFSNNAKMEIRANKEKLSSTDVFIINQNIFPLYFKIGLDNSGNKSTGENLINLNLNVDNLIGINDNLYIKYTQNLELKKDKNNGNNNNNKDNNKKYNKSFYSSLSIPFGYWTVNSSLSYSKYLTTVDGQYTSFNVSGDTLTQVYGIDRVLFKNNFYKINIGTDLTLKDVNNYIGDLKSRTGSRRSSNNNLYINNVIFTKFGTLMIKPSYQKGLKLFSSKIDETNLLNTEPRLQYNMFKLYIYYNTRLLNTRSLNINYSLTFDSQYSKNTLYGTDQFSIGGEYTVRGFKETSISGDDGYYVRNDLMVNIGDVFDNVLFNNILNKIYFSLFFDYGFVKNKYSNSSDKEYNSQSGFMSGAGVSLNYYGKYFNSSITYAKALHSLEYLRTRDNLRKERYNVYWRVEGRW